MIYIFNKKHDILFAACKKSTHNNQLNPYNYNKSIYIQTSYEMTYEIIDTKIGILVAQNLGLCASEC